MSNRKEVPISQLRKKLYLTDSDLGRIFDVPAERIRRWEKAFRILRRIRPKKGGPGRARYPNSAIAAVEKIVVLLKNEGLSLRQARAILNCRHDNPPTVQEVAAKFPRKARPVPIDTSYIFTSAAVAEVCDVDIATARRYLRMRRAPYCAAKLIDLYGWGRVLAVLLY